MNGFFQKKTTSGQDTFATKYKPNHIGEFAANESLKNVLTSFIAIDDLNILISGPTCCGKTTMLYAIIRDYYGLHKNDSISEHNILLINNLKEQGINYYRNEMKTFCQSRCSIYGKKKLIIVDDLDLISDQCQQVFRNYIDKYKGNIHFISVCTTLQKVIESIQSRLHIIHMEIPDNSIVASIVNNIITSEKVQLAPDAKDYILTFSNHNIREAINYLEKICILRSASDIITLDKCKQYVSCISFQLFDTYITHLRNAETMKAIRILYNIYDYGYSVIDIFDFFFHFIKMTALLTEREKYLALPVLCKYITYFHNIHEDIIETSLFTYELQKFIYPTTI